MKNINLFFLIITSMGITRTIELQEILQKKQTYGPPDIQVKCKTARGMFSLAAATAKPPYGTPKYYLILGDTLHVQLYDKDAYARILEIGNPIIRYNDAKICWACRLLRDSEIPSKASEVSDDDVAPITGFTLQDWHNSYEGTCPPNVV